MSALVCLGDTWLDPDVVAAVTPAPGGTDIHIIGLPKIFIQGAYPAQIASLLHPTP